MIMVLSVIGGLVQPQALIQQPQFSLDALKFARRRLV